VLVRFFFTAHDRHALKYSKLAITFAILDTLNIFLID